MPGAEFLQVCSCCAWGCGVGRGKRRAGGKLLCPSPDLLSCMAGKPLPGPTAELNHAAVGASGSCVVVNCPSARQLGMPSNGRLTRTPWRQWGISCSSAEVFICRCPISSQFTVSGLIPSRRIPNPTTPSVMRPPAFGHMGPIVARTGFVRSGLAC